MSAHDFAMSEPTHEVNNNTIIKREQQQQQQNAKRARSTLFAERTEKRIRQAVPLLQRDRGQVHPVGDVAHSVHLCVIVGGASQIVSRGFVPKCKGT